MMPHVLIRSLAIILLFGFFAAAGEAQNNSERDRAVTLLKTGKSDEAIAVLTKLIDADKQDAQSFYYLGVGYIQTRQFKKATEALQNSAKLDPASIHTFNALSFALISRNKLDDATKATNKALALDSKNPEAHYNFGMISLRHGRRDEALAHAEAAIQSKPDFAEAYLLKSEALVDFVDAVALKAGDSTERLGNDVYVKAAEALKRFFQITPDSPSLQLWRDQLENLKFYSSFTGEPIYKGKDVTTKPRLITRPEPSVPAEAHSAGGSHLVVLKTVFKSDGSVKNILVIKSAPYGLTESCIRAARSIKFHPALIDGKPVSLVMQLEYYFDFK